MSPRLRITRLADSGIVQFMPPVRRSLPRTSATISTPDKPDRDLADAGQRKWIAPIRKPSAMPMPIEM